MIYFTVLIEETGESFRCSPNESLLVGMERLGKKGIPVGCRGGGCGVCKVEILEGTYQKREMSRDYVSVEDEAADRVEFDARITYESGQTGSLRRTLQIRGVA